MDATIAIFFSLFSLLLISVGVFFISKRIGIPYTVGLVTTGLILVPLSQFPALSFITSFELTPELLFFVFLPTLIFESAYNMKLSRVMQDFKAISLLAVVSFLLSTVIIAGALYYTFGYIGLDIPFIVLLLFGTIISATDPVAVLALFKEYGAPKRLSLVFEGESLFNDATAFALFLIIIEIMHTGWQSTSLTDGLLIFVSMMAGGIVLGALIGTLFSKIIEFARDNEYIEITLTMIVAHMTFLIAEFISHSPILFGHEIHISSIIATVVSSIIVGNYGRNKMSIRVQEYMEDFWGYFAFIANSLVFILIGLLFVQLPINITDFIVPIAIAIAVVVVARALSIYPVTFLANTISPTRHIPKHWQHLLAWGSLRGALAIIMVLLIPDNLAFPGWELPYSIKDFITALTIGAIYFTLFIKATTIGPLLKKLGINKPHEIEQVEYEESRALIYAKTLMKLTEFKEKGYIDSGIHKTLMEKYTALYDSSHSSCNSLVKERGNLLRRVLSVYAIGIEKNTLKNLYMYKEITEPIYTKIHQELDVQFQTIEHGSLIDEEPLDGLVCKTRLGKIIERSFRSKHVVIHERYMYFRAKRIMARKATKELKKIATGQFNILQDQTILREAIEHYQKLETKAHELAVKVKEQHPEIIRTLNCEFAERGLLKAKEKFLEELKTKELITPKVYIMLKQELEKTAKART
jgi:CPA1 family monovalent cation:H+ antiporter